MDEKVPEAAPIAPLPERGSIAIEEELRTSYLDYAMSVIVSRAIPDVRDGLKPVHRRILYSMHETGNSHNKPYRKSARPVGEVMGKYHPHGDAAIYAALVRMAQDFTMSLPLLDGQGNFGSIDNDPAAAMRYTEVRMAPAANAILADIGHNTVDFIDNYDGKDKEPTVLPARLPNLFVNGSDGIAVGMATRIPPHNLGEIIDATLALIDNPDISIEQLMSYMPAPDFPTGGIIVGRSGAMSTYYTGSGSITVRAKTRIIGSGKEPSSIVVDEIPYKVNKSELVNQIARAARDRIIEGIARIRDESDRSGVRIVIELKRDATPEIVLNQLWHNTSLQSRFSCNVVALNGGRPERLNLAAYLSAFVAFREEIVTRRTAEDLRRARARSHLLCGLAVAVSNVDEIVAIIRSSSQPAEARQRLMARKWPAEDIADYIRLIADPNHEVADDCTYVLSETQARAILELRLQRLTAMGVKETTDELQRLAAKIVECLEILSSGERISEIVSTELIEVKDLYAVPRRTEIEEVDEFIEDEDLIEKEDMVVTITRAGYVKRTPLSEYRAQKRGGKGLTGITTKDEDFVTSLHVANTHTQLLVITTDGNAYTLKTWGLPKGGRGGRGKAIVNLLPIESGVSFATVTPVDLPESEWERRYIVLATSSGSVRRNPLSDFVNLRKSGKIAIRLPEGVTLVGAAICSDKDDILLATRGCKVLRFPVDALRVFKSRLSSGVRGIRLAEDDEVVSLAAVRSFTATTEEHARFLRMRRALARSDPDPDSWEADAGSWTELAGEELSQERFEEMQAAEELLLTVGEDGSGKVSSSFDYRAQNRGGLGVLGFRYTGIVGFLKVRESDQVMLVTNSGKSIRCPVEGISFRSRTAGGVRVFDTAGDERVVSVARIAESDDSGPEHTE